MNLRFLFWALLAFSGTLHAQTYADDVAALLFDNCTSCHHNGGVAPFSLMSYAEAQSRAAMIQNAVVNQRMPPWPPNSNYSRFAHERTLTPAEIATIDAWANNGAPQGNPANTPATPTYNPNNWRLGTPDLSLRMPNYISRATPSSDDYICLSLPTNLLAGRTIQAIEIIPGNTEIVHHALIHLDVNGSYVTDTTSHSCGGPGNYPLIGAYLPGSDPIQFINSTNLKVGVDLPANSHIILAMHYPYGSQGMMDSTRINFHFYPQGTTGIRQITARPILSDYLFTLNANTVSTLEDWFPSQTQGLWTDQTIYGIFPHAHLLGKSFLVYGVNNVAPHDTIPLMHIPQWDFDWQGFYAFKYLQKIPAGYRLYAKGVYDNTTNNPFNPNNPPQNVSFGENTTDEMFLIYLQYMDYVAGDEHVHTDSLLRLQNSRTTATPLAVREHGIFLSTYPNPSEGQTTLHYHNDQAADVELGLYNLQGQLVRQIHLGSLPEGEHLYTWNGRSDSGQELPPGVYTLRLQTDHYTLTRKLVRY